MNEVEFIVACEKLMGAPFTHTHEKDDTATAVLEIENRHGALRLVFHSEFWLPHKADNIHTIMYHGAGVNVTQWPRDGFNYIYEVLSYHVHRQIQSHARTVAKIEKLIEDLESLRRADVHYEWNLEHANPTALCKLETVILFELRHRGVQYVNADERFRSVCTDDISALPRLRMQEPARVHNSGNCNHGIKVFQTEGAYFVSKKGTITTGKVYCPQHPYTCAALDNVKTDKVENV